MLVFKAWYLCTLSIIANFCVDAVCICSTVFARGGRHAAGVAAKGTISSESESGRTGRAGFILHMFVFVADNWSTCGVHSVRVITRWSGLSFGTGRARVVHDVKTYLAGYGIAQSVCT